MKTLFLRPFLFSNLFVNLLWLWCGLPNHSGKCGFQTFQKVKCSPCFSGIYFQDNFCNFWQTFLASLSTARDYCFIEQQTLKKKKKTGVPAGSIYGHIEAGCVFVGMEGVRGKYKIVPRFQRLNAVIHKLRNWHLKLLKLKILFNHVLGNITFTLYSVSSLLVDRNSIYPHEQLITGTLFKGQIE